MMQVPEKSTSDSKPFTSTLVHRLKTIGKLFIRDDEKHEKVPRELFNTRVFYRMVNYKYSSIAIFLLAALIWFFPLNPGQFLLAVVGLYLILRYGRKVEAAKFRDLSVVARVELCKLVSKDRPSLNLKKWNSIAVHMNNYIFEQGLYSMPYFFWDGEECRIFFLGMGDTCSQCRNNGIELRHIYPSTLSRYHEDIRNEFLN